MRGYALNTRGGSLHAHVPQPACDAVHRYLFLTYTRVYKKQSAPSMGGYMLNTITYEKEALHACIHSLLASPSVGCFE